MNNVSLYCSSRDLAIVEPIMNSYHTLISLLLDDSFNHLIMKLVDGNLGEYVDM